MADLRAILDVRIVYLEKAQRKVPVALAVRPLRRSQAIALPYWSGFIWARARRDDELQFARDGGAGRETGLAVPGRRAARGDKAPHALEDWLRGALCARAEQITVGQDAWPQTVARARRPGRQHGPGRSLVSRPHFAG